MTRVVIAAGGTAGHVVPALAVADALRARGAEVEWIGGERAEASLVPAGGYPLHTLRTAGLDRRNPFKAARAAALAGGAVSAARRLLRELRADAVLGGGGYASGPVGLAAATLRLPLFLTEADSHVGVANRLLAPLAQRLFLAFPVEGREGPRYPVTGRPVPAATGTVNRGEARERLGLPAQRPVLLVFGGSLGARRLNHAAVEAFGAQAPCAVLHVSGRRDHDELRALLGPDNAHYRLLAYVEPFADALAACDLVAARSGGSVWEVVAAGAPSILVPYPEATADHQAKNAAYMARAGAALVVPDEELDAARLGREVATLISEPARLAEMAAAARAVARPEAADRIAAEVLAITSETRRARAGVGSRGPAA